MTCVIFACSIKNSCKKCKNAKKAKMKKKQSTFCFYTLPLFSIFLFIPIGNGPLPFLVFLIFFKKSMQERQKFKKRMQKMLNYLFFELCPIQGTTIGAFMRGRTFFVDYTFCTWWWGSRNISVFAFTFKRTRIIYANLRIITSMYTYAPKWPNWNGLLNMVALNGLKNGIFQKRGLCSIWSPLPMSHSSMSSQWRLSGFNFQPSAQLHSKPGVLSLQVCSQPPPGRVTSGHRVKKTFFHSYTVCF